MNVQEYINYQDTLDANSFVKESMTNGKIDTLIGITLLYTQMSSGVGADSMEQIFLNLYIKFKNYFKLKYSFISASVILVLPS